MKPFLLNGGAARISMSMDMVLAAVDDLLFTSKISAAARQRGVEVAFAKSSDDTLRQARSAKPLLIIFDLNSSRLEPLRTIAALRDDADLAGIRRLGFVSHVQGELIAAARAAGCDEVLARSAFTARLPDLLGPAGPPVT
jgi:CheY-like chemotaxis protein